MLIIDIFRNAASGVHRFNELPHIVVLIGRGACPRMLVSHDALPEQVARDSLLVFLIGAESFDVILAQAFHNAVMRLIQLRRLAMSLHRFRSFPCRLTPRLVRPFPRGDVLPHTLREGHISLGDAQRVFLIISSHRENAHRLPGCGEKFPFSRGFLHLRRRINSDAVPR